MTLDENDKAVLRRFAASDRRHRWAAIGLLPLLPFPWYWMFQVIPGNLTLGFICSGTALFASLYVAEYLPLWIPRAGSPARILAGGRPTIRLTGTVVRANGDSPNEVSIMVDAPAPYGGWTNESIDSGFRVGDNLTVVGFATERTPFRYVTLYESETGRRWWSRGVPGGGTARWRTPEAFG